MEREHITIVEEWKQNFGSLSPPLPSTGAIVAAEEENWDPDTGMTMNTENAVPGLTPQDFRQALRIVENGMDYWDSDDDNVDPAVHANCRFTAARSNRTATIEESLFVVRDNNFLFVYWSLGTARW